MLVGDILRRNAATSADLDAVVEPGRVRRSWGQLDDRVDRLGRALLGLGLAKGDRLALYAPNCAEYLDFFFACARTGIVGVVLNVRLAEPELVAYLSYTEPAALLVHADLAGAPWVAAPPPSIRHVVGFGGSHGRPHDLEQLLAAEEARDPAVAVDEGDTYQLGATSGTTGVPKAAVLTHRNAIAALLNWASEMSVPVRGTNLQSTPLYFNPGGPTGLHPVLLKGGRTVVPSRFDATAFAPLVAEYGVTHSILVPTMIEMVLAAPATAEHDLSTLVAVSTGGSAVPLGLLNRARQVIGDVFFPQYGLTETYSSGLVLPPSEQGPATVVPDEGTTIAPAGRPHVLALVRVVDSAGDEVPRDGTTAGEVWIAGDSVSPGYFRRPEDTAAARHGAWFRTGDLATVDPAGAVRIVDRLKDVIISGGINVYSREVEGALEAHPDVARAAVIGLPDPHWGERVHAVVVPRDGAALDGAALIAHVGGLLASYKKPRSVEVVDELPLSGAGKVLKRELRARHQVPKEGGR